MGYKKKKGNGIKNKKFLMMLLVFAKKNYKEEKKKKEKWEKEGVNGVGYGGGKKEWENGSQECVKKPLLRTFSDNRSGLT